MKILILQDALQGGGTEFQMRLLRQNWPRELPPLETASLESSVSAGANFHALPRRSRFDLSIVGALVGLADRIQADLIYAPHRFSGLIAKLALFRGLGRPVVCGLRGRHVYDSFDKFLYDHLDMQLMRRAAAVVLNASVLAEELKGHPAIGSRLKVIPNGVDLAKIDSSIQRPRSKAAGTGPLLVSMGRLVPVKEPFAALDLLYRLRSSSHPQARLRWIGDGPLREEFLERAMAQGLSGAVEVTGMLEEPWPLLAEADLYVHFAAWENLSNAILEAMACALPVLARPVGGNAELVLSGESGSLVSAGTEFVTATEVLLGGDLREMGARGRARVEEFYSVESMVEAHRALFAGLLS